MIRTTREIKSFSGAAWGERPEVKLAGGPVYQGIILTTNLEPEQIISAELFVNGDPRIRLTGEDMKMLERFKKKWEQDGKFFFPIGDFSGNSLEGQMISGLETSPTDNLIFRVTVAGEPDPNTQGNVTLSAEAIVNSRVQSGLGDGMAQYVPRITTVTFHAGQSGLNIHDSLPHGEGVIIKRVHLKGELEHLRVLKDKRRIWERSAGTNEYLLKHNERAPQPGYFHFDAVESGFILAEMMDTVVQESMEWEMRMTNPGTVQILLETLERIAPPAQSKTA
ncbi:major capsid protein P2 [Alcanivorax sp.]|uniref:major capsid protein P2 n=1 Tax=Alcanivorax sp. TaxID=1872427 RepID=UPI0025BDB981|nr:major capsid protein P2 [Alcanivorax sp.]